MLANKCGTKVAKKGKRASFKEAIEDKGRGGE